MKFLFVHQNFPGQFLHIVRHLAKSGQHDVVFISEANENAISGVRRVIYKVPKRPSESTHPGCRELDLALNRADAVGKAAVTIRDLGFTPDIIIGHHGWGELLNLQDIFPSVPQLGYFEFFYHTDKFDVGFDPEFPMQPEIFPRVRSKNAINLLALDGPSHGQTPTEFQRSTYPEWARSKITVLREGVDLEACSPDPKAAKRILKIKDMTVSPKEKLVTYVARDLEPYRGFHVFMRALPAILEACPDARIALVGGDGVSYGAHLPTGTWRQRMLSELQGRLDLERIHFLGKVAYDDFLALLKRSDAHVYLTYPFVASWSLREAMAMGCAIVGSATAPVEEFIEDRKTGLLTPFTEPKQIAQNVIELLENRKLNKALREAARAEAERTLCMTDYLQNYEKLIEQITGQSLSEPKTIKLPVNRKVAPPRGAAKTATVKITDQAEKKPRRRA